MACEYNGHLWILEIYLCVYLKYTQSWYFYGILEIYTYKYTSLYTAFLHSVGSCGGVCTEPSKRQANANFPVPKTKTHMREFWG